MFLHSETSLGATAVTASDGSYSLQLMDSNEIPVGEYQISIGPPEQQEVDTSNEEAYAAAMMGGEESAEETTSIPEKYQSTEESGLTFTVQEGSNTHDIDLEP
jgi:hypothetical protein